MAMTKTNSTRFILAFMATLIEHIFCWIFRIFYFHLNPGLVAARRHLPWPVYGIAGEAGHCGREEFSTSTEEERQWILKHQVGNVFIGLSLNAILSRFLLDKEAKLAERLRAEFDNLIKIR